VLEGEAFSTSEISGVVTRLPWIGPAELEHVAETDRAYVAAEMHAFLFAWLSRMPCPIVNRPTPHCLSGPAWRNEQWIHAAAAVGIPVRPARRSAVPNVRFRPAPADGAIRAVTVVDGDCVGDCNSDLEKHTRSLAAAAGCTMLTANYEDTGVGFQLLDVSLWPDLIDPTIRSLVLGHFTERRAAA
jgi:hypothetical protein